MTNKHYKGNEMIRRLVIGADFVILNIVLLFYTQYTHTCVFRQSNKDYLFCCQCCLVPRRILLFHHHSCQKDRVPAGYKAYFISGCSNNILFFYLLKTTRSRGKDVLLQHYLRHNILSVSHHKPTLRAQITKVFPL